MSSVRHLWAGPVTLLGLLLAIIGGCAYSHRSAHGAINFRAFNVGPWGWFFRRWGACTIGAVIVWSPVVAPWLNPRLQRHEDEHVRQSLTWGPLFPVLYYGASMVALLRGGRAYQDNHFEQLASAAEDR